MSLKKEMEDASGKAGGALRTREHRERIIAEFCALLRSRNDQTRHIRHVKVAQIKLFVEAMLVRECSRRTVQNAVSALKTTLRAAGRGPFCDLDVLSNRKLGIADTSRYGTHKPVDQEHYAAARAGVLKDDPSGGIAAVLRLQATFGLRALEALVVQGDTLRRWKRELPSGYIMVVSGTKGGRPRRQTILDGNSAELAISEAQQVLKKAGKKYLVEGQDSTLKSAYDRYHYFLRKHGLRGEFSSHGLRYAWTHSAMQQNEQRFEERESLQRVAQDLGHGDGRGRYVRQVYYQPKHRIRPVVPLTDALSEAGEEGNEKTEAG